MKRENKVIYAILAFFAAMIGELYCLLQYREDLIIIIGVGVLVVIAAYFVADGIYTIYIAGKEEERSRYETRHKEIFDAVDERLGELNQLQKAIYIATKGNSKTLEEGFRSEGELADEMINKLSEIENKTAKLVIKYSREDAKNIATVQKKAADEMIGQLSSGFKELKDQLRRMDSMGSNSSVNSNRINSDVTVITDCINRNFDMIKIKIEGGFELVEGNLSEIRDNLVEFKEEVASVERQPVFSQVMSETRAEQISVIQEAAIASEFASFDEAEEKSEFDPFEEAEAASEQEDIGKIEPEPELENEIIIEPEPETKEKMIPEPIPPKKEEPKADSNQKLSQDDIAAMIASMGSETVAAPPEKKKLEPVSVPTEAAATGDPNKQMSADEIAALIAGMAN